MNRLFITLSSLLGMLCFFIGFQLKAQSNDPCALANQYQGTICAYTTYNCGEREDFVFTVPDDNYAYGVLGWTVTQPNGSIFSSYPDDAFFRYTFPNVPGVYVLTVEVRKDSVGTDPVTGADVFTPVDTVFFSETVTVVSEALPAPVFTQTPDHVCAGTPATVRIGNVANAVNYTWQVPNGWTINNTGNNTLTTTQTTITINAPSSGSGTAAIQVRANNLQDLCYDASSFRTFNVTYGGQSHNIIGATTVNPNEGRYYYIEDEGVSSVTWQVPFGWSLQGTQSGQGTLGANVYTGRFSGKMRATYVSCGVTFVRELQVNVTSTPIIIDPGFTKTDLKEAVTLYPNPSRGSLTLEAPEPVQRISVHNALAQLVREIQPGGQLTQLDLSDLETGIYLIEVEMGARRIQKKVLLQD